MHTLRGQFDKEMKAITQSKKSGAGTEDVYQPKLWCYHELTFLTDSTIIRQSQSSLEMADEQQSTSSIDTIHQESVVFEVC